MPRKPRPRTINLLPEVLYFKPRGVPLSCLGQVNLLADELEALYLADFKGKEQHQAAKAMGVSQSTFQRILARGRKKTAEALVVGKAISLEGGEKGMVGLRRGMGLGPGTRGRAPVVGGRGRQGGPYAAGPGGVCVCTNPKCNYRVPHQTGVPCYSLKCEKCGSEMVRQAK